MSITAPTLHPSSVYRLVPMAHVRDVEGSLAFYELLGFRPVSVLREPGGKAYWARASSGAAEIMFARASGPVNPAEQAVLFYMYSTDVRALRAHLLEQGLADGAAFRGQAGPGDGTRVVFDVARPPYMPEGEVRVSDPDGYCVLVGQPG